MTKNLLFSTWRFPHRRPVSNRSLSVPPSTGVAGESHEGCSRSIRTSHKRTITFVKTLLGLMLVALGYYYFSSESMLDKYALPASAVYHANPGSRLTSVVLPNTPNEGNSEIMKEAATAANNIKKNQAQSVDKNPKAKYASVSRTKADKIRLYQQHKARKNAKKKRPARLVTLNPTTNTTLITATADDKNTESVSYVHYIGCCGIGHRLARMSNAYHAAQRLNFALRGTWPSCDKTNVFEYLFEPENHDIIGKNYTRSSQVIKLNNEVPGYTTVSRGSSSIPSSEKKYREGNDNHSSLASTCDTCHSHKIDSDYQFYSALLQRFRKRDQVQEFLTKHAFANHTVIGMHIRAGNGEGGDFENKKRGINNSTQFVKTVRQRILQLVNEGSWKDPPLIFLATDTPWMVDLFRQALENDTIPIVELPQIRPSEGSGILFGEKKRKRKFVNASEEVDGDKDEEDSQEMCLLGWDQAFMDMMILASSDVVIATRRSSFVQTIPLSIVLGRPHSVRKVSKPYCEVSQDASLQMTCHETYMDWCCCSNCVEKEIEEAGNGGGKAKKKRRKAEYVKQLRPDLWDTPVIDLYQNKLKPRKMTDTYLL